MLAERFGGFLLDLDGVVYLGEDPLPGAVEALARLRGQGKAVRFLTNDPRPTREEIVRKLTDMGVEAGREEVVSSGAATADYLRKSGLRSAYVVGGPGLLREIHQTGVEAVGTTNHASGHPASEDPTMRSEAVVVGGDEHVGYDDLERAARLVRAGSLFVATNPDGFFPSPEGLKPAAGAFVAFVAAAAGREPDTVVGKPHPPMFEAALGTMDLGPAEVAMIGDNPQTDLAGARRMSIFGVLVRREGTELSIIEGAEAPDAVVPGLLSLFDF